MVGVTNVVGWIHSTESFKPILSEQTAPDDDFYIQGLLLPKNKVSRNGVLYDWESVKKTHRDFIGATVNFNHKIDDDKKPIGIVADTWIKETDDADGKAGLYYKIKVDKTSEYADSIRNGFLNKVSLQVKASATKTETDDNGNTYTRAYIEDPLEISVVKVPGFKDTTMEVALAEAFNMAEQQTTANNPSATMLPKKEDHIAAGKFPYDEFKKGFDIERAEHPDLGVTATARLVLDHLDEDEYYYTNGESVVEGCTDEDLTKIESLLHEHKMVKESVVAEVSRLLQENKKLREELDTMKKEAEEDKKVEEVADEDEQKESDDDMDKLVDVVEALHKRIKRLEESYAQKESEDEDDDDEDEKVTEGAEETPPVVTKDAMASDVKETEATEDEVKKETEDSEVKKENPTQSTQEESSDDLKKEEDESDEPVPPVIEKLNTKEFFASPRTKFSEAVKKLL